MKKTLMTLLVVATLSLFAKDKVLFFVAPPDECIACSGTLYLMKDVFDVHIMVFTHGERGSGEKGFRDGSTKVTRTREEKNACKVVGATLHWCDEIDGDAYANRNVCRKVADFLKELKPRAVGGMWPHEIIGMDDNAVSLSENCHD